MAKRNRSAAARSATTAVTAETVLVDGLATHPEVQTVMEIAMRAREIESLAPTIDLDMTAEVRATPINPQGLWQNPV